MPGETHDSKVFTELMAEHDADPEVMLADKGYDSDAIRTEVRARGGTPAIPHLSDPGHVTLPPECGTGPSA